MKKNIIVSLACSLLTAVCFGGLAESLESRFASVTAEENGLLIVFKTDRLPYRVSVEHNDPTAPPFVKRSNELGEYFIPYDCKWPIRIGHKDSRIYFEPLSSDVDGQGFFLRESDYLHGGRSREEIGTLLYLDSSSIDERSYKIIDEREYMITRKASVDGQLQPPITNEVNVEAQTSKSAIVSGEARIMEKPVPKTNTVVALASNAPPESIPQTVSEEKSSSLWKLIFPVIGVLLVAFFAFFKFRKR